MANTSVGVLRAAGLLWTILLAAGGLWAQGSGGTAPGGDPSQWLPTSGMPEKWVKTTAKCRELLAGLKLDDPLVRKHLPNVRDKAELLRKTPTLNWRTVPAVEFLQNMLTDLIAGEVPNRRYAGKGVAFPYWSEAMGRTEAIWLHVPPGYDPQEEYQLFMCYKCGGGIHYKNGRAHGGYRPSVEVANQTDTFFAWSSLNIQIKGRMNANTELAEAVPAMAKEFSISPDRVFLTGYSDGGFTAIWVASRFPHLVAGIAPDCANWQYSNVNQIGLYNVPFLVVDGWGDSGYVQKNFSRWHALHSLGYPVACIFGKHGHTYAPYENVAELKQILEWAKRQRRESNPRKVRYATWNLYWHRAHWLSIERMIHPSLAAQIEAEVKTANRIEVKFWNVGAYRLSLNDKLVDPTKPLTVWTNGKRSYEGAFKDELLVEVTPRPGGNFLKGPASHGGIAAHVAAGTYGSKDYLKVRGRRWLWVKPTAADAETAKLLAKWYPKHAKADAAVTAEDIADRNLFLYGGPEVNSLTARIAAELPVTFGKGRFTVGRQVYDQPTHCVKLLHPNPLNPKKFVIVYAFNDAAAFAQRGFFGTNRGESAWKFRTGDCVVMGIPGRKNDWGVAIGGGGFQSRHFVFGPDWRPADGEAVGELESDFDYAQILRLRADAMREATGADLAIIRGNWPSYLRWNTRLSAGSVTLHDLATVEMLPEYVTVAEVAGDVLYRVERNRVQGLLPPAVATSVLTDKRDPSYDPESSLLLEQIDPKKTYRVAMGYGGLPTYGVNPRKMPDIFFFRSPAEFAAHEHASLPVRNMRQIPLQVTEAVARYVQKRKRVSPRPMCFNLTDYVLNPKANHFGACDWLHLGLTGDWGRLLAGKKPMPFRYTLNLGLRAAEGPPTAPPRKNSKRFLEFPLAGKARLEADFAELDGKLPVLAAVEARKLSIQAATGPATRPAGAAGGIECLLVDLRLTNRGDRDLVAVAVLAPTVQMRNNPNVFTAGGKDYIGLLRTYRQPDSAAVLVRGAGDAAGHMIAPGAGWNAGLMGVKREFRLKAGATTGAAVLFLTVNQPVKSADHGPLTAAAKAVRAELMKILSGT